MSAVVVAGFSKRGGHRALVQFASLGCRPILAGLLAKQTVEVHTHSHFPDRPVGRLAHLLEDAIHPPIGKGLVKNVFSMRSAPASQKQKQTAFRAQVNACLLVAHDMLFHRIQHALRGPRRHDPMRFL